MFRALFSVINRLPVKTLVESNTHASNKNSFTGIKQVCSVNFSSLNLTSQQPLRNNLPFSVGNNLNNRLLQPQSIIQDQVRTVIKFSWKKGTRKSVKVVLRKFYRLNCGNWIRRLSGCHRRRWYKNGKRLNRADQHVFCNATQCRMLDKMVSAYWRKPKYFIKSPYEPYEWRESFPVLRQKPWRPEGCDYE